MKMAYNSDGTLTFDLAGFMDCLPPEGRIKLAESIACDSEVIRHVTAQILDGCTENGFYGPTGCNSPDDPAPCQGLDWAKRQVAKRAGEVAAKEIARLEEALKEKEKALREALNQCFMASRRSRFE